MGSVMRKRLRGFTLLELMAVVIILGILSVVAVVSYKKYQAKARLMQGYGYIHQLRTKQEMYYSSYSQYVSTGSGLTAFYPFQASSPTYLNPGTAWGINCSSTSGDATAEGFCALGFSPGSYTNWAFVTLGWYPGTSTTTTCINDTTKPWWVIRVMTAGTNRAGSASLTSDCYQLRATSETNNVYEHYCIDCSTCNRPNCGP